MDEAGRVIGQGRERKFPYSKDRLLIDFMTFHFRLMRLGLFHAAGDSMSRSMPPRITICACGCRKSPKSIIWSARCILSRP